MQASFAQVYKNIKVEGVQRLEENFVLHNCGLKLGGDYNQKALNKALKDLYSTGNFVKVDLASKGSTLIIKVVESPMINKVIYEGNKAVGSKVLDEFLQMKPRQLYSLALLKNDIQKMRAIYRNHGYFTPRIVPKIIKLSHNRVNLVYEIKQGKRAKVLKIEFIGNDNFDHASLSRVVMTKEYKFYKKLMGVPSTFDPDRLEYDKELLRNYYLNNGFLDFKVYSSIAQLSADGGFFIITFMLEEGHRYKIKDIVLKNDVKELKYHDIKEQININKSDFFSQGQIEAVERKIKYFLAKKGFVGAKVKINRIKHKEDVTINVHIIQGEKRYIDKIIIEGNNKTRDYVLRRVVGIKEGDPYNEYRIFQAKRRLYNLGYFKSLSLEPQSKEGSDFVDLIVKLEEDFQGQFIFNNELGTMEGAKITFGFGQENLFGTGRKFSTFLELSPESWKFWNLKSAKFDIGYFDKHFLDFDNLGFGIDFEAHFFKKVYYDKTAKERVTNLFNIDNSKLYYDYNNRHYDISIVPLMAYRLNDNLVQTWKMKMGVEGISYSIDSIKELNKNYDELNAKYSGDERKITLESLRTKKLPFGYKPRHSSFFIPDVDVYKKISLQHYLTFDRLDNRVLPNNGYEIKWGTDLRLLFPTHRNSIQYLANHVTLSCYKALTKKLVFSWVSRGGLLSPLFGSKPRLLDHFHLGDNSLRGYAGNGIGPRDQSTAENEGKGTALGGHMSYKTTIELRYPIPKLSESLKAKIHGFIDLGGIVSKPIEERFTGISSEDFDFNFDYSEIKYSSRPRVGVGIGVSFKLPAIGNIRLDFARAINPRPEDVKTGFHISSGTRF